MKGVSVVKIFPVLVLLILLFGIALPALADYLGPNRTVTTWVWERKRCEYVALYDPPGSGYYACTLRLYEPPDEACPEGGSAAPYFNPHPNACGASWPGTCGVDIPCQISLSENLEACHEGESGCRQTAHTVTYPEAAIHGELRNCGLQNGWCVTLPWLSLRAVEPLVGYSITAIEGTHNGEAFACQSAACEIPLQEGENVFTYWALSSWGDSSRMGNLTARVDTRPPQIQGAVSGTGGENGWYVSAVTFTASASDPEPGSGVAVLTYALDDGTWTPYTAPVVVSDGVHAILFRAQDAAGHTSEINQSAQVDTLPPQLETVLNGEQANGWYLSQVVFSASARDSGSGLARLEYALDGGDWREYHAPLMVGDGVHTLHARAFDLAGNATEAAPLAFRVDGTRPGIALPERWPIWERVAVTARDGQSGLAKVEVTVRDRQERWPAVSWAYAADGTVFTTEIAWDRRFGDGTLAPIGEYEVVVEAQDAAGNATRETAHIVIPAPGETVTPLPTHPPTPSVTPTAAAAAEQGPSSSVPGASRPNVAPTLGSRVSILPAAPVGSSGQGSIGMEERGRSGVGRVATPKPGFPWWLLAAGGAAAYAASKRKQIAQGFNSYWAKTRERKGVEERAALTLAYGTAQSSDRIEKGRSAVQNANAWIAEEKVIEPELRRLQVLNSLNQADYWRHLPGGVAQDLTLIEGIGPKVQRVLNDNGYHTMADLAIANPAELRRLLQEQKWHFMDPTSWVHQARLAATGDQKGLQALQNELKGGRGPLPQGAEENLMQRLVELEEIAENRRLSTRVLDGVDSVSDVLSIGGNLVYAATGWEAAKKAGEAGDALGIFGGIAQIAKCMRVVGQSAPKFSKIFTGVSFLGKVTGVLSIVTGGISAVTSGVKFVNSIRDEDGWKADSTVELLNSLSGLAAMVGGVMLLIPGAQPIAGIALGLSAVLSGAAVVVENWGWITSTLQNSVQVRKENGRQARQIAATVVERGGEALAQGIEHTGERLARAESRAAENAAQSIERGTQAAGRMVQAASQAVSRGIETLGNAAAQGMRHVTQAAAQAVNNAGQALARGSERAANTVASWVKPFSPGLASGIERAGQAVSQAVANITQRVSSTIAQRGQAAASAIQRGAQAVASAVSRAGQTMASSIVRGGQSAANAVRQAGQAVSSSVQKLTQTASSKVKSWASSIAKGLRGP